MMPNILVYSRIYDDVESVDSLRKMQASDQTPEGRPLYSLRNTAYENLQEAMFQICKTIDAEINKREGKFIVSRGKIGELKSSDDNSRIYSVLDSSENLQNSKMLLEQNPCSSLQYVSLLREVKEIHLSKDLKEDQKDVAVKIPSRMIKWYHLMARTLPPASHDQPDPLAHMQAKVKGWLVGLFVVFCLGYIFSEIDFPVISKDSFKIYCV